MWESSECAQWICMNSEVLKVCVWMEDAMVWRGVSPPKSKRWKPNTQGDGTRRWDLWEGISMALWSKPIKIIPFPFLVTVFEGGHKIQSDQWHSKGNLLLGRRSSRKSLLAHRGLQKRNRLSVFLWTGWVCIWWLECWQPPCVQLLTVWHPGPPYLWESKSWCGKVFPYCLG